MKRKIIKIDEKMCNGCGQCIPNCPEGALQIIDGKARIVSELSCDGLGACIGHCPEGAITIEEREAAAYDELKVISNISKQGKNTIKAHLKHLKEHNQHKYLKIAVEFLNKKGFDTAGYDCSNKSHGGCPGMQALNIKKFTKITDNVNAKSELSQWPVQLKLINPAAEYFKNADLLIAADCSAFAYGNFHQKFLKDKKLIIFCPKLDGDIEEYTAKLAELFKNNNVSSVTALRMEVPCCSGIAKITKDAIERSGKDMEMKEKILSLEGQIIK